MTLPRPYLDGDALIHAASYEPLAPLLRYLRELERYADSLEAKALDLERLRSLGGPPPPLNNPTWTNRTSRGGVL
jgi:hypothetical protein